MKKLLILLIVIVLSLSGGYFGFKYLNKLKKEPIKEIYTITLGNKSISNTENVNIKQNDIFIKKGGEYNLTGILNNGTIFIDTKDEVILNLNKVTIVNENNSAINNRASKKLILNVTGNNILSDGKNSASTITSRGDIHISGSGNLLVYGNNANGITSNFGSIYLDIDNLYVASKKDSFYTTGTFNILSGTIIGLGSGMMQVPNSGSKQNTFLFNFDETIKSDINFSLYNTSNEEILAFKSLKDFKTITLSSKALKKDSYYLLKDTINDGKNINGVYNGKSSDGYKVKINITNTFKVNDFVNWYGKLDVKRSTLEENFENLAFFALQSILKIV